MRIYSLIMISITMIINLLSLIRDDKKNSRIAAFISFCLYLPVFIYLINI